MSADRTPGSGANVWPSSHACRLWQLAFPGLRTRNPEAPGGSTAKALGSSRRDAGAWKLLSLPEEDALQLVRLDDGPCCLSYAVVPRELPDLRRQQHGHGPEHTEGCGHVWPTTVRAA
eukprot:CAMPEP_0197914530 /NCGR_PEP_ID=MMETSP1439-20131203/78673_1 /TAXON_ID=66791 /ORGANISM="Gonyaulax spinifera, Strain CCMP409" /LENGTH=117 /DNA_ID=CAMNT_0043536441 /DNA_START=85 /DNA_END=435 /DNA_ORIENTATION=-